MVSTLQLAECCICKSDSWRSTQLLAIYFSLKRKRQCATRIHFIWLIKVNKTQTYKQIIPSLRQDCITNLV